MKTSMLLGCFARLPIASLRRPRITLAMAGLVGLCCLPGLPRLRIRTDGCALVSGAAPEVVTDQRLRDQFRIRDTLAVVIRPKGASNIFNPATLALVRELTAAFQGLAGITPADVMSLATEPGLRRRPGTLMIQGLLEPAMISVAELEQVRGDLERLEIYTGTLVSVDFKATLILVGMPNTGPEGQAKFLQEVRRVIAARASPANAVGLVGAPLAEAIFGGQILKDLGVPDRWLEAGLDDLAQQPNRGERRMKPGEFLFGWLRQIGLVPLSALVMTAVLLLFFRNVAAALVPFPGVAATLLFTLGSMGWSGVPVYLTTAVMPVLLTVLSVTNDIYLFARYFSLLRQRPQAKPQVLLEDTFRTLAAPVGITSLAAAVGFLSFAASPLVPVKAFGLFAALGTLFSLLLSLSVVPALLSLINPARFVDRSPQVKTATASQPGLGFEKFGRLIFRHRWWVIGATCVLTALTPFGICRLRVQDSWMSGFPAQSEFRRLTAEVDRGFFGSHTLLVAFDAGKLLEVKVPRSAIRGAEILLPGDLVEEPISLAGSVIQLHPDGWPAAGAEAPRARVDCADYAGANIMIRLAKVEGGGNYASALGTERGLTLQIPVRTQLDPKVIQELDQFERYVRQLRSCSVGGVLGAADYLSTIRFIARGARTEPRGLPESAVSSGILWDYYRALLGRQRLTQVLDETHSRSLLTIFLKDANFADTAKVIARLREYERQHLAAKGIKLEFAGTVAVSQSLIAGIVSTQMYSLLWSSVGIFAAVALLSGSWLRGLYCLLPSLLALAIKFAVMGWAAIPLGVATSMFAAMTLGIGANCAIHLLDGCERARRAGTSVADAWLQSLRWTGPAALLNAIALCFGFGVLMVSQVPANSRLGTLLVLGLASCALASLTFLPALQSMARGFPRCGRQARSHGGSRSVAFDPLQAVLHIGGQF
jgi:predicted RND superfamily exporter protein